MFRLLILFIIMAFATTGCATVNRGIEDHFRIDTVPQGAKVTTSILTYKSKERFERLKNRGNLATFQPEYIGCEPTPCAIELPRYSEFTAKLEYPGYEPTDIFIRSSNLRGGSTASAAANLSTAAGAGLAFAGSLATYNLLIAETLNLVTFQTLSIPTGNISGIASSGAAIGLGVGAGLIAIDASTGANRNFFPNPVVIELVNEGDPKLTDPLVDLYWKMTEAESQSLTNCKLGKYNKPANKEACKAAKADLRRKKAAFNSLKREQMTALKDAIKTAKQKSRG